MVEPEAEAPEAAGGEVDGPAPVATGGGEHDAPDATADATAEGGTAASGRKRTRADRDVSGEASPCPSRESEMDPKAAARLRKAAKVESSSKAAARGEDRKRMKERTASGPRPDEPGDGEGDGLGFAIDSKRLVRGARSGALRREMSSMGADIALETEISDAAKSISQSVSSCCNFSAEDEQAVRHLYLRLMEKDLTWDVKKKSIVAIAEQVRKDLSRAKVLPAPADDAGTTEEDLSLEYECGGHIGVARGSIVTLGRMRGCDVMTVASKSDASVSRLQAVIFNFGLQGLLVVDGWSLAGTEACPVDPPPGGDGRHQQGLDTSFEPAPLPRARRALLFKYGEPFSLRVGLSQHVRFNPVECVSCMARRRTDELPCGHKVVCAKCLKMGGLDPAILCPYCQPGSPADGDSPGDGTRGAAHEEAQDPLQRTRGADPPQDRDNGAAHVMGGDEAGKHPRGKKHHHHQHAQKHKRHHHQHSLVHQQSPHSQNLLAQQQMLTEAQAQQAHMQSAEMAQAQAGWWQVVPGSMGSMVTMQMMPYTFVGAGPVGGDPRLRGMVNFQAAPYAYDPGPQHGGPAASPAQGGNTVQQLAEHEEQQQRWQWQQQQQQAAPPPQQQPPATEVEPGAPQGCQVLAGVDKEQETPA